MVVFAAVERSVRVGFPIKGANGMVLTQSIRPPKEFLFSSLSNTVERLTLPCYKPTHYILILMVLHGQLSLVRNSWCGAHHGVMDDHVKGLHDYPRVLVSHKVSYDRFSNA